ncbi:replication protein A, subunit RPA32 [Polyplosphaeria fusca]|uniref:Replication protein A, subunit RPA32 n=1 Tax=Polyplosphaeria fusca TaxID=682080 RepID=A0A9P4R6U2_9PLEO|nr:replication protein A, subunit RPA32 [Polyplosphaeria fusca]
MNSGYQDTSYNSYAGGGAAGGGFIPDGGSQTSPSGGKSYAQDSLRPVTIKQLHDAQQTPEETVTIDGAPITQLTLVGQIRNISSQTTNITYKLDDGTGSIEVKLWVDSDNMDTESSKSKLVENSYCRVWGKLKIFNNKKHVGAHIIRPVDDMDEVSYHLLDATATHLYFTRGPPGEGAAAKDGSASNGQEQYNSGAYGKADLSGYSPTARKVYKYLSEGEQSNEGLHQQAIAAQLGIEVADVARAGDELLSGGLIYTTIDDETWAVLEAD